MDIIKSIEKHEKAVSLLKKEVDKIEKASILVCDALNKGAKILLCGNGGSAADSQHIAAEFVGRFIKEREGLPAVSLTTDTSILTAVGNDYGYNEVFRRQVEALGNKGDVLIGISTSGNSENVVRAFNQAKKQGLNVIALTGSKDSKMSETADIAIQVRDEMTARIQECHIMIGHLICEYVDCNFLGVKM